jgi:hypothetical protein
VKYTIGQVAKRRVADISFVGPFLVASAFLEGVADASNIA